MHSWRRQCSCSVVAKLVGEGNAPPPVPAAVVVLDLL
eukprot:COSAG02_NODE_65256_length_258_cov_0.968553_1_plen_36_part_10